MATLNAWDMAAAWIAAGGAPNRTVAWLSVSLAESSWNTDAVSPTDARGLYQMEPGSWPESAGPLSEWRDPNYNSRAAVILSGGGVNFAPWDTAYANIYRSGRYAFLQWPEESSAASSYMPYVSALLGNKYYGTVHAPETPGLTGGLPDAIRWYGEVANTVIPVLATRARGIGAAARRAY